MTGLVVSLAGLTPIPDKFTYGLAASMMLVVNFYTCRHLVFLDAEENTSRQFFNFLLSSIAIRLIESGAFWIIVEEMKSPVVIASVGIQTGAFFLKFFVMKTAIFKKRCLSNQVLKPEL